MIVVLLFCKINCVETPFVGSSGFCRVYAGKAGSKRFEIGKATGVSLSHE